MVSDSTAHSAGVVAPDVSPCTTSSCRWYAISGYIGNSPSLLLPVFGAPRDMCGTFYVWYGEVFDGSTGGDNAGTGVFDITPIS